MERYTPSYINASVTFFDKDAEPLIGIENKGKLYVWWRNFTSENGGLDVQEFIYSHISGKMGVQAILGPSVDLGKSNPDEGVVIDPDPMSCGIYVEKGARKGFNYRVNLGLR